jgi:hypothetical protein
MFRNENRVWCKKCLKYILPENWGKHIKTNLHKNNNLDKDK